MVLVAFVACAAIAACKHDEHVPSFPGAVLSTNDDLNSLYLSDIDGYGRRRISIGYIAAASSHGGAPDLATSNILGARFSPDGTRIFADVVTSPDSSQLIVFDRSGANARTASEAWGYVYNFPAWSPDSTRIAHVQGAGGPYSLRLMVTNLATDEVSDTGLHDNPCSPMAWDATGEGIYCGSYDQDADQSRLTRFDLATQTLETLQSGVPGEITDIAADGDTVLLVRKLGGGVARLVRHRFFDGSEISILDHAGGLIGNFLYSEDDVVIGTGEFAPTQFARISNGSVRVVKVGVDHFRDFYPQ